MSLLALITLIFYKLSKNKHYWRDRGVPDTGFAFLWGDEKGLMLNTKSSHELHLELYKKFPEERFYGGWALFGQPYLMLRNDFELIRSVMIKDFDHFAIGRANKMFEMIWPATRTEWIAINNILTLRGEMWKDLR